MMKTVKGMFKKMGEGLALASAGELRPDEEKVELLARHGGSLPVAAVEVPPRVVLAGDDTFARETMEHAIALCQENRAMLDLLYVTPAGDNAVLPLETIMPRLESEPGLDFQVIRRHGDLFVMIDNYLRAREDIVMILINVSARLRKQAARYQRDGKWSQDSETPEVELIDTGLPA